MLSRRNLGHDNALTVVGNRNEAWLPPYALRLNIGTGGHVAPEELREKSRKRFVGGVGLRVRVIQDDHARNIPMTW
jgi:hypothetical protein